MNKNYMKWKSSVPFAIVEYAKHLFYITKYGQEGYKVC